VSTNTSSAARFALLPEPWSLLGDGAAEAEGTARPLAAGLGPLLVAEAKSAPRQAGRTEGLAAHGPPFLRKGTPGVLQGYDLPASDRHVDEALAIYSAGKGIEVSLTGQVPRPHRRGDSETEGEASRPGLLETFVDSLVGVVLELRADAEALAGHGPGRPVTNDPLPLAPEPDAFERGTRLPLARLPWPIAARRLLSQSDEPRMDVIVRIAFEFKDDLVRLAESPRRILRRERRRTPVGRVQQVDSTCLVWLVRQPGRTAVEKAGPTQQILAVVRTEDYDTLENRVLKDFLHRCIGAADLYIREHKGRFEQSTRYKAVAILRDTCRRLLRDTPLAQVRSLPGFPQPNYVLLHDRAYRELWGWYVRLVRRQKENDDAWRWQRRLWADFVRLRVACELIHADAGSTDFSCRLPFVHDLWLREEQDAGSWLHPTDWPGPIWLKADGRPEVIAQVVHPHAVVQDETYDGLPVATWLGQTGADVAVIFRPSGDGTQGRRVCLFVWAVHSAAEELDDPRVRTQTQRASEALARLRGHGQSEGTAFRGLILRSHLLGGVLDLPTHSPGHDIEVTGACVPSDPRAWHGREGVFALRYALYDCLAHVTDEA